MGKIGQTENLSSFEDDWVSFHYLPYSEEDEKLGMVCTTAGSQNIAPDTVYPPFKEGHPAPFRPVAEGRKLPEYQIIYITEGEGVFSAAGKDWNVPQGSMLLVLPGLEHAYKPKKETGWQEYWAGFIRELFQQTCQRGLFVGRQAFFQHRPFRLPYVDI